MPNMFDPHPDLVHVVRCAELCGVIYAHDRHPWHGSGKTDHSDVQLVEASQTG